MSDTSGYPGQQNLSAWNNLFNAISFLVRQTAAQNVHVTVATVKAVTPSQTSGAPPTVDVQPLVAMVDQVGTAIPHGVISGLPTMRLQGGPNGVIIDPQVGDIGIVVFADRDISSALANQGPSNPGSFRKFDWADGIYIGGIGRIDPSQSIAFLGGIAITSPGVSTSGNLSAGTGASGSFSTPTGQVVTVVDGIIVDIS